jgi:copper chaperone CopZ
MFEKTINKLNNNMKTTIKILTIILAFGLFTVNAQEQEKEKKVETIEIKTSVVCGMCKDRVEHDLAYEKGVKFVEVDLETKMVTVEYKTSKTNPDKIRKAISKIGYDADGVVADEVAYEKLPACCKKDAPPH